MDLCNIQEIYILHHAVAIYSRPILHTFINVLTEARFHPRSMYVAGPARFKTICNSTTTFAQIEQDAWKARHRAVRITPKGPFQGRL